LNEIIDYWYHAIVRWEYSIVHKFCPQQGFTDKVQFGLEIVLSTVFVKSTVHFYPIISILIIVFYFNFNYCFS